MYIAGYITRHDNALAEMEILHSKRYQDEINPKDFSSLRSELDESMKLKNIDDNYQVSEE